MTLATRLSLFFLGSLAVVLCGFSTALYLLAHTYLHGQLTHRLDAGLRTLTAAIEIKPDRVELEPGFRHIDLGPEEIRWAIRTTAGSVLAGSPDPPPDGAPEWHTRRAHLTPPNEPGELKPEEGEYPALVVTVAVPIAPTNAELRVLLGTLVGLSVAVWLVAALVGRWLCRRMLSPVTRMATSARAISSARDQRLPVPATGDELADLGRAFNELLDRLQDAFERQRRFTAEASHQLRTPLAVVRGQIEVALRRERSPEEYQRVLLLAGEQAQRLHRIVEQLLLLARSEETAPLPLVPVALRPWLAEHLATWAAHPRAADIRLSPADDALAAAIHPALLGQFIDVLLDNACKYSPAGSAINVTLATDGDRLALTVEDHGCGIPAEDLPRVFEPFFRSPQLGELGSGGVGLGLALARRIAAALGASLDAESQPGQGSRFTLRLSRS
jgi:signal transduction histidine kinase